MKISDPLAYSYHEQTDKWNIGDAAADYLYTGGNAVDFALPGTLKVICDYSKWKQLVEEDAANAQLYFPLYIGKEYLQYGDRSAVLNFVSIDTNTTDAWEILQEIRKDDTIVACLWSTNPHAMASVRKYIVELTNQDIAAR
jgi:(E)-4-hydroxy-3-methylbut-2-enyl-diphosphate synthase